MCGHIFCGPRKGAGWVPAGKRPGSVRWTCAPHGSWGTAGVAKVSIRCPTVCRAAHWTMCSLTSAPRYSKLRCTLRINSNNIEGPVRASSCPNGQIKTPGELEAANSAPRRPYTFRNVPAPVGTIREPAGQRQKSPKMSVFTRRTGPGVFLWKPHYTSDGENARNFLPHLTSQKPKHWRQSRLKTSKE